MTSSRTNRFIGGLGMGYLQQVLMLGTGLWLTPFLLKALGQYEFGMWLIITQITAYLGLLDLGVVGLLPREVALEKGRSGSESPQMRRLVNNALRTVAWQTPIVIVLCAGVWWMAHLWRPILAAPLAVILLAFCAFFPFRLFAAILQGLQDLTILGQIQTVSWILGSVITVWLTLQHFGIMALAISWAVNQAAVAVFTFVRLRRSFAGTLRGERAGETPSAAKNFKQGLWISVSQIAQVFNSGTDVLVVGKVLGATATVPYSLTGKLTTVLANKPQLLMQTAFPGLSELRASGSRPRIRHATGALSQAMLSLSGLVVCLVIALNRNFVAWWTGPQQFGGVKLSLAIAVAMLVKHWGQTFTYSLFCFGYERRMALTSLAEGCCTVAASFVLVYLWGPIGAPLGAIIGYCTANLPLTLFALGKELASSPLDLLRPSFSWLLRFVPAAACCYALDRWLSPRTFWELALTGLAACAAYIVIVCPVLLKDPLGSYVRPRLAPVLSLFRRAQAEAVAN